MNVQIVEVNEAMNGGIQPVDGLNDGHFHYGGLGLEEIRCLFGLRYVVDMILMDFEYSDDEEMWE